MCAVQKAACFTRLIVSPGPDLNPIQLTQLHDIPYRCKILAVFAVPRGENCAAGRVFGHQTPSGPLLREGGCGSVTEGWNINSNPAINQTEICSSAHFPGNGCNNNVIRVGLVTIKGLDGVHANDLASHSVHFTTKRREIFATYFNVLQVRRRTSRLRRMLCAYTVFPNALQMDSSCQI